MHEICIDINREIQAEIDLETLLSCQSVFPNFIWTSNNLLKSTKMIDF